MLETTLLEKKYLASWTFRIDVISILPTDVLYAWLGVDATFLRFNRLLRVGRLSEFQERFVFRTRYPNVVRIGFLALVT